MNAPDTAPASAPSPRCVAGSDEPILRQLLDDYLKMYATRDPRLTGRFSENFSGFTGGGDFLVKDRAEWVAITRLDFAQVKDALRLELTDVRLQSLSATVALATSFFRIHLPIPDSVLSREMARLVLVFRQEGSEWKIAHSSISIPYHGTREGEVYPLRDLADRNRFLEEQVGDRTRQLSEANANLARANEELAAQIAQRECTARQLQELLTNRTHELREATAAALRAGTDEEDRIGRELHDTLCPELIGLARQAETLAERAASTTQINDHLRDLAQLAGASARRARNLSHLLARPDTVHATFAELLQAQLTRLEDTLELTCELSLDEAFPSLSPEAGDHLIRIVREAVTNAARHAHARRVWVDGVRQGDRATLSISNDGSPLPPLETLTTGIGLRQMRMRANLLEADLALRPGQSGGAVVALTFAAPACEPPAAPPA
jgi:signal transduction histidine kinase